MTSGGVVLPESAKEKPLSGIVIRTGPGKRKKDGELEPPKVEISFVFARFRFYNGQVKDGDKVLYFKYAGEQMETSAGEEYVVIRESDILCKA